MIHESGADECARTLAAARKAKRKLQVSGVDTLIALLQDLNRATHSRAVHWLLLLELYQTLGQQENFEDLAVDYAVRFEMSPPSWSEVQAAEVVKTAPTEPQDDALRLSGEITPANDSALQQFGSYAATHNEVLVDLSQVTRVDYGSPLRVTKPAGAGAAHTVSVDHIEITVHYSSPPPAPVLVSPAEGAVVSSVPALDWTDVADPDGDAVTYEMQADNDGCAFASPEVDASGLATSTFSPGALAEGTYCWRARAVDSLGAAGSWSATRKVALDFPGSSQTRSPGTCTTGGGAGNAWNNPGNALSSNNADPTVSVDGSTSW